MSKHFILSFGASLSVFFITACSQNNTSVVQSSTTTTEITQKTAKTDTLWHCLGTEPFWSAYILSDNTIAYDGLDEKPLRTPITASATTDATASFAGEGIAIALVKEECTDGMSDNKSYPYSTKVEVNGKKLIGCGEKK